MRTYELIPMDNRKSFYNKAFVVCDNYGNEILFSYGTPVAEISRDKELTRLWGGWSATTARHIDSFCLANGLKRIRKREWEAMETDSEKARHWVFNAPSLPSFRAWCW